MARKLEVDSKFYKEDFLSAAKLTKDKRHYQRLLALHYMQLGKRQLEVSALLGAAPRSIQQCVNWHSKLTHIGIEN
jgi:hypothetical protein